MSKLSNGLDKYFSHKPMQEMAKYLNTYNIASQALAIDGSNAENIQTTGTGGIIINGLYYACAEDAELDISADTGGTETAWATATSYTAGNIRSKTTPVGPTRRFRCILAHTSADDNKPEEGKDWELYWEFAPNNWTNASGTVITTLYEQWFAVFALSTGVISLAVAGTQATIAGGAAELKIPHFDPLTYCCIGVIKIAKDDAGDLTVGTTALTGDGTYVNLVGPVFPHPDNLDLN
jgi:hypothetical protein